MSQTFSLDRFVRLLRKYFIDNQGQLLANLGMLLGGFVVLSVLVYSNIPRDASDWRYPLFFVLGWASWYVFTMQQTTALNQKERAITYLLQPASQVEKIMLIWLISGLGFVVVFLSIFSVFDLIGVWFVNHREWSPEQLDRIRQRGSPLKIVSFFDGTFIRDVPNFLWVFTALLHSFTLAFALLVRRHSLAKVVIIAFALIIFGFLGNDFLFSILTGAKDVGITVPFSGATVESPLKQYQYRSVDLPQPLGIQLRYIVGITVIILLYITAYVRLKEREV